VAAHIRNVPTCRTRRMGCVPGRQPQLLGLWMRLPAILAAWVPRHCRASAVHSCMAQTNLTFVCATHECSG
jgi:hypothetical protein